MKLEDLEVYNISMDLSDKIWVIVDKWDFFKKDTVGKQLVRAIDSVSANISEGFGRNTFKDQRSFYYYSRGSLYESKTWITKAKRREIIDEKTFNELLAEFNSLGVKLNNFIASVTKLMNSNYNGEAK
ncbi:MAG: four helix bundle protein [Paludibacter sp.]